MSDNNNNNNQVNNNNDNNNAFHLTILEIVKLAQSQHGLRHNDYMRYRQYCSRRLRRLRKSLKVTNGRRDFKKKPVDIKHCNNNKYLHIPLIQAERAWAYAMQLKQSLTEDTPRVRFHLVRRLRKARAWSSLLLKLCNAKADQRTQLEAEAYNAWMCGNVYLEEESWKKAVKYLSKAKTMYDQLGKISDLEQRALCQERVMQIEPAIRYCTFILKRTSADGDMNNETILADLLDNTGVDELLQSKLENILAETRHKQAEQMSTVLWGDEQLTVKSDKVRILIIEARDLSHQIQKMDFSNKNLSENIDESEVAANDALERHMQMFVKILTCYDDAMQLIRTEIKQHEAGFKGTTKKSTLLQLNKLLDYLLFTKLNAINQRNQLLVDDLSRKYSIQQQKSKQKTKKVKPEDLMNLYQRMLNTLDNIEEVCQRNNMSTNVYQSKRDEFVTFRLYYRAESFRRNNQLLESVALYQYCLDGINKAEQKSDKVKELSTKIESRLLFVKAKLTIIQTESKENKSERKQLVQTSDDRSLLERLDEYVVGNPAQQFSIANLTPAYHITPCKPILFDLANNYLKQEESESEEEEKEPSKPPPKQSSSWLSWLRGGN